MNKTFRKKQLMRLTSGCGFLITGIGLLFKYCEEAGWCECQSFIRQCHPDEYASITKKELDKMMKH